MRKNENSKKYASPRPGPVKFQPIYQPPSYSQIAQILTIKFAELGAFMLCIAIIGITFYIIAGL